MGKNYLDAHKFVEQKKLYIIDTMHVLRLDYGHAQTKRCLSGYLGLVKIRSYIKVLTVGQF